MALAILTGFDGSCPHFKQGIRQVSSRSWVVRPNYRIRKGISEEAPGDGSRLSLRILNRGPRPENMTLVADWETTRRVLHHDLGYIRPEADPDWTMIPGWRQAARITYKIAVPPGLTHFGLYPEYNVEQCENWIRTLRARRVTVEIIGRSREKRAMWLIRLPSGNPRAVPFFIHARDHAYETAGSYSAEGMVEFLLSDDPLAHYLRSKFNFAVMPMTNPDGVYNGMSRLTWERGANLNRVQIPAPDAAHAAVKKALDRIKPRVMINIHNWTDKFMDGLLCNQEAIAEYIQRHMPADHEHFKYWYVQTHADYLRKERLAICPEAHKSWKNYGMEKFDAWGVTFEFPWFALNTAEMRAKGRRALVATALATIETSRW